MEIQSQRGPGEVREGQSVLRVQLLTLGGGLKKPWLGEGLWLGGLRMGAGEGVGTGCCRAVGNSPRVLTVGPALPPAPWLPDTQPREHLRAVLGAAG